jgi:hypothetical protein
MTKAQTIRALKEIGCDEAAADLQQAKRIKPCNICRVMMVPEGQHACVLCD